MAVRFGGHVLLRGGRGSDRRPDDRGQLGVRGRLWSDVGRRVVAVLRLGRVFTVVAESGQGQDRQRDRNQKATCPHPDIVESSRPSVKLQSDMPTTRTVPGLAIDHCDHAD